MKSILSLFILVMNCCIPFTQKKSQYELDFINNEERIIKENNLITKQEAADIVIKYAPTYYPKMDKTRLKQMLNPENTEVILFEDITPEEIMADPSIKYYYTVNVRFSEGRIMVIRSLNAKTGKEIDAVIIEDEPYKFWVLITRDEVMEYIKKHFFFPDNAKIKIEAVCDYSLYMYLSLPNMASQWKYRITIQDGLFTSASYPTGTNTLFITPYIAGRKGIRETPAADNAPGFQIIPHRIFVKHTEVPSQETLMAAESGTGTADVNETRPYYGVD